MRLSTMVLAAAVFVPYTLHRLPSADLWWALADGRLGIPLSDPFSYTAPGHPWYNDQWLVAGLFYVLFQWGGLTALQLLKTGLLCVTFALAADGARRRSGVPGWFAVAAGAFCMAFSQYAYFFDVRAYLFSYLNLVALWLGLQDYRSGRRWCRWAFPILFALWVNEHAGVMGGLAFLMVAGIFLDRLWWRTVGLCWAATLLNPSGYHILTHAFRLLSSSWGAGLNEWQPYRPWPYLVFLLLTLVASRSLSRAEQAVLLAFGALSLTGWRHIPLFCWLAITPWAALGRRLPAWRGEPWLAGLAAVAAVAGLARYPLAAQSMENQLFPRWACDFLAANPGLGKRLFHPYGFGGYLLWRLGPERQVFIDGRAAQVYPVEIYEEYLKASRDPAAFQALAERYQVDAVLTFRSPDMEVGSSLVGPGWTSVYQDDLCELFVRGPVPELVRPPSPAGLVDQARRAVATGGAEGLLDQALRLDPEYAPSWFLLGTLRLQAGSAEGVTMLERALALDPTLSGAHLNLAVWFAGKDRERARREAQAELERDPGSAAARELLRRL